MVAYTYSRVAALNFNTTPPGVAKSATGSVYAVADTTFTTPLNMTMVVGGAVVTTISSDAQGFFPDFTVADRTSVVWKQASSSFTTVLTTSDPVPGPQGAAGTPGTPGVKGDRGDLATWVTNTFYPLNMVIANPSGDLVKVITAHTSGASYDATKFDYVVPPPLTPATLNATYGPTAAGMLAAFAPNGAASPRQVGDGKSGALDYRHEGTAGYLTHFVMGVNSLALAGCYAAGTDLGAGDGFFVSHKNSGAGIRGVGHGGSSILQYMIGYGKSTLYNGEIYKDNQGVKLFAKIGEGFGDGVSTSGSTTFTSATAVFTGADVGATISQTTTKGTLNVSGTIPSGTTIASVTDATTVVLSAACTASGTGINFLLGGRTPATTQSLFTMYDTNGTSKRYEFALGKYTGIVPHEIQSNAVASQSLLVKAAVGHTAEILTVLKDGNASGALSVLASGLVATRFGTSLSNAGSTGTNVAVVTNTGTTAHSLYITRASAQTGDQISLRDNAAALQSRFNKDGVFMTKVTTAPADADLNSGEVSLYFDSTNGAAKLKIKAKQADGTVRTGEVALA